MLNRLLDLILCGDCFPCAGTMCARWLDGVPPRVGDQGACEPQSKPPVPAFVRYPQCPPDNVSVLYEGSLPPSRCELRPPTFPDDLDLSVEHKSDVEREGYTSDSSGGDTTDASSSRLFLESDRQFFDELYYTPLRRQESDHYRFDDGDGSSYSTNHNFITSSKTNVTDVTHPTNHTPVRRTPSTTPSGTQVSV